MDDRSRQVERGAFAVCAQIQAEGFDAESDGASYGVQFDVSSADSRAVSAPPRTRRDVERACREPPPAVALGEDGEQLAIDEHPAAGGLAIDPGDFAGG
ncbi:MAG TPA: hypothetical protein VL132_15370 [Planctomycetaceae bacterium]|nr:hypothetical protein [Planctomycetaceae bacterium]